MGPYAKLVTKPGSFQSSMIKQKQYVTAAVSESGYSKKFFADTNSLYLILQRGQNMDNTTL